MALVAGASIILGVPLSERARAESADWLSPNKAVLVLLLAGTPVNTLVQAVNAAFVVAPLFPVYFVGLIGFLLYAAIGLVHTLIDAVQGRSAA